MNDQRCKILIPITLTPTTSTPERNIVNFSKNKQKRQHKSQINSTDNKLCAQENSSTIKRGKFSDSENYRRDNFCIFARSLCGESDGT